MVYTDETSIQNFNVGSAGTRASLTVGGVTFNTAAVGSQESSLTNGLAATFGTFTYEGLQFTAATAGATTITGSSVTSSSITDAEPLLIDGKSGADILIAGSHGDTLVFDAADISIKGGAGTANMAAVLVAKSVGGDVFYGFISAVAFATILAVVAGLTLSGASAVSHDLYATVFKGGKADSGAELRVSRITTVVLGIVAVALGIAFEKENIAFMVSLAFAIAASANFPVLFLSILWKGCTTRGAVIGGFLGLISSVGLTIVSPAVWEATLGNPKGSAWFQYSSPALFSMTIGFVGIWLFSVLDKSEQAKKERAAFPAQQVRSETGYGAAAASDH